MKSEKYHVKIKLHINPTSKKSDMHEFRIDFFEIGDMKGFLLS